MLSCSGDTWKEPHTAEKVLFPYSFPEGQEAVHGQAAAALLWVMAQAKDLEFSLEEHTKWSRSLGNRIASA